MTYHSQSLNSPAGLLHMICDDDHLLVLAFDSNWPALCRRFGELRTAETPITKAVKQQLGEYFAGSRRAFTVPVKPQGTAFQTRVWEALLTIPYGRTASYRDQATRIGKPQAARAVGHANGQNPISIIIPCHRVIATSGALTGYAGGLAAKQFLLEHERA